MNVIDLTDSENPAVVQGHNKYLELTVGGTEPMEATDRIFLNWYDPALKVFVGATEYPDEYAVDPDSRKVRVNFVDRRTATWYEGLPVAEGETELEATYLHLTEAGVARSWSGFNKLRIRFERTLTLSFPHV